MSKHIPTKELIEELRTLAWKLQRHPTTADMDTYGAYSAQTYQDRFGSWSASIEEAGLADLTEPILDDQELLTALRNTANEIAEPSHHTSPDDTPRPPTHQKLREHGEYSPWLYIDRFDSWVTALDTAGFGIEPRIDPVHVTATDEDLLVALHEVATAVNRTPTTTEMDTYGDYASQVYIDRFGSWDATLTAAELPSPATSRQQTHSEADLLGHLQTLAADLGRTPTTQDMYEEGAFAPLTYQYRFGSWNTAIEAAGLEPNPSAEYRVSDAELIDELQTLATELGRTPTQAEMNARGAYSATTYAAHFGSWNDAIQVAELSPNPS